MPFQSKAQVRAAFAGAIPGFDKKKALEWAHETKNIKKLPEYAGQDKEASLADLFTDLVKLSALGTSETANSKTVGRFKGFATEHSLKAPGMAASATAVNPRRSLVNAISAFKA